MYYDNSFKNCIIKENKSLQLIIFPLAIAYKNVDYCYDIISRMQKFSSISDFPKLLTDEIINALYFGHKKICNDNIDAINLISSAQEKMNIIFGGKNEI